MTGFYRAAFLAPVARRHEFKAAKPIGTDYVEAELDFYLPSEAAVRGELARQGFIPLAIRRREIQWWQQQVVGREYRQRFLGAIAFHVRAGLSPAAALRMVIEGEEDTGLRSRMEPALEVLRRGGDFSEAFRHLRMFDPTLIAILVSGERAGRLPSAISSAADHMRSQQAVWKKASIAILWVGVEALVSLSTGWAVQFKFLPWLEKNGIASEDAAKVEHFNSAIQQAYQWNGLLLYSALALTVTVALAAAAYASAPRMREWLDMQIARLPLFGRIIEDSGIAATTAIAARLAQGHVPLTDTSDIASQATYSPRVRAFWRHAKNRLLRGLPPGEALAFEPLSRAERLQLQAHQDSGQLADVLMAVAEHRAERAGRGRARLIGLGMYFTIGYGALVGLLAIWVLSIQNDGLGASLSSLGG